jgi:hypothetical protein
MDEGSSSAAPTQAAQPWYRRRRTRRNLIITGVVLALLGLAFSYAPRYIARHLIASELDQLGIEHEGIDTLRINPWKREAWIGPVGFQKGPAPQGRLGELGIKIRLGELFNKHALIERLLVRGIDLRLTRAEDGRLFLNGVPLEQFVPEAKTGDAAPADEAGWGAGLDGFELRESRLIFDDQTGGELVADIDRLVLGGFRTWSPEEPGRYELDARVNDIEMAWTGTATPFADNIRVLAKSRIEGADLPKVIRFTGPLGLDRREGTYSTRLDHEITVFASGRIEGSSTGTIEVLGADYARSDAFALTTDRADLDVDTRYTLSEGRDFTIDGAVTVDLQTAAAELTNEMQFALSTGKLTVADLAGEFGADHSVRLAGQPLFEATDARFTGRLKISINQILELLAYLQSLSAGEPVTAEATGLDDWSEGEVVLPKSNVTVEDLNGSIGKFELVSAQAAVALDLAGTGELSGIEITSEDRTITARSLRSVLDDLALRSGQGKLTLRLSGNNILNDAASRGPVGELKISSVTGPVETFELESRRGLLGLRLQATSDAKAISGVVYEEANLPETGFEVGSLSASLANGTTEISPDTITWAARGAAEVTDAAASVAKGQKAAFKFKRFEVTEASADQNLAITADTTTIGGLEVSLVRSFLEALKKSPSGDEKSGAGTPADRDLVREIQRLLGELGFDPGAADGIAGRKTRRAIRAFQQQQGLSVDGEVTLALLRDMQAVAAGGQPSGRSKAVELPKIALNRFALVDGATVRFVDDVTEPQVKIATVFEKVEVRNLDTTDPSKRAEVQVAASVNEFSRVEVDGWASHLGLEPDFDVRAKVTDLQLPSFSPYAVKLAGMYLQSGQLSTTTNALAQDGALDGQVELDMRNIKFEPLSEEDAKRLADQTGGMPIDTVVALLQDSKGRIELNLPLQGSVTKPDVDLSSAITKAIGGAFKSVFRVFRGKGKSGIGFEPIVFQAGSAELTGEGRVYADGLVELLTERPKLTINVCGSTTLLDAQAVNAAAAIETQKAGSKAQKTPSATVSEPTEQPPPTDQMAQQLTQLAVERTRAVRRYLITERGIDPGRVAECRAAFDAQDTGPPRAEVSL